MDIAPAYEPVSLVKESREKELSLPPPPPLPPEEFSDFIAMKGSLKKKRSKTSEKVRRIALTCPV
jgi:hypothetical protein